MMRLRPAVLFSLLLALALALVACGGSDEKTASSNDVNELLTQTFTGSKKVDSGNLSLGLTLETVSRQISALKNDGVIELGAARRIVVPDIRLLMAETGDDMDGGLIA